MPQSLSDLADQYASEADNLEELIAACKARRKAALRHKNGKEATRLERLAELHEQQRSDLLRLAAHIRRYHDTTSGGSENQSHERKGPPC